MDTKNETPLGLYIAVEGIDGSGKSTVLKALKDELEAEVTREPGGPPLAEEIRLVLQQKRETNMHVFSEFALFWAARFSTLREAVMPRIEAGKHIVSDRCEASTWAYQIRGREHPALEEPFWALRKLLWRLPDAYFYLDVSVEEAHRRIFSNRPALEIDRFDLEEAPFMRRVREGYEEFFRVAPGALMFRLDASKPPDEVAAEAVEALRRFVATR